MIAIVIRSSRSQVERFDDRPRRRRTRESWSSSRDAPVAQERKCGQARFLLCHHRIS
jgi:hypothetical protein